MAAISDPDTDAFEPRLSPAARRRVVFGLVLAWLMFWVLMAWVSAQDHWRNGGTAAWRPVVNECTSMLTASALLVLQWWRGRQLGRWLAQPLQWFARLLGWLPLVGPLFVVVNFNLRAAVYGLAGEAYSHESWGDAMLYELPKFAIYFGLFAGVQFGVLSYRAWHIERLRAERLSGLTQQAKLAQLTQQLQPHFLFNALNTISALIHSDPDHADALLGRLAALLRAATDAAQRPEQPLADELALVRGYAEIMLERFGDRARIDWRIDDAALACRVPTLSLQVLLENTFKHVVEKRRAATSITVSARSNDGQLRLAVQDDGGQLAATPVFGVGLGNLRQRLASLHGDAAGLSLNAVDGGGVRTELWLPCAC